MKFTDKKKRKSGPDFSGSGYRLVTCCENILQWYQKYIHVYRY